MMHLSIMILWVLPFIKGFVVPIHISGCFRMHRDYHKESLNFLAGKDRLDYAGECRMRAIFIHVSGYSDMDSVTVNEEFAVTCGFLLL